MELQNQIVKGKIEINDYAPLLSEITAYADNVCKTVLTQDNDKDIKKYRADINKKIKSIEDARKMVKKEYSTPLVEFEDKMKTLKAQLDRAVTYLDTSLNAWEEDRKAKRLEELKEEYKDRPCFEKAFQEKWLNKTTTKEEIDKDLELYSLRQANKMTCMIEIKGSEENLQKLVEYMKQNDIEYRAL